MPGTVFVVRHAKAGSRSNWAGPDSSRPLTAPGVRQAEAIAAWIATHPVTRIVSSPYVRCRQTVEPLAAKLGIPVETDDALREGAPLDGIRALIEADGPDGLVLCSHGDVITELLQWAARDGAAFDQQRRLEKGSVWELEVRKDRVRRGRYHLP